VSAAASAAVSAVPLVEVTRRDMLTGSEFVESVHLGHLAVVEADGTLVHALGDPHTPVFPRSAVKPFQAAACVELLDAAGITVSDEEVAVGWASHRAEPAQLAAVRALLERAGITDEGLTCPRAGVPDDPTLGRSHLAHNCSGKHAMFALAARTLGLPVGAPADRAGVLAHDGPLQTRVLATMTHWTGPSPAVGVDGCGAPAVVLPLSGLARAFAHLATDARLARVRDAGLAHPLLVAGTERRSGGLRVPLVDSALLTAGVVAKRGAEGVLAAGWRTPDGRGRGVAVKALDGAMRGAATALVALLERDEVVPMGTWREATPQGGGVDAGTVRAARAHDSGTGDLIQRSV
jgi:L-asparaginase II